MANMKRPVRPVRWSFGMGVGEALRQTGTMYGQLGQMQLDAEALEAERKWRTGEREEGEAFTAGQNKIIRDTNAEAAIAARRLELYDQGVDREHDLEDFTMEQSTRSSSEVVPIGDVPVDLIDEFVTKHQQINPAFTKDDIDMNMPVTINLDGNGAAINIVGKAADYSLRSDNIWAKTSAESTTDSMNERNSKIAIGTSGLEAALTGMADLIGMGDIDLRDPGMVVAEVADNRFTRPFANWFQEADTQQYLRYRSRAGEILFKIESGAAGSEAETARYLALMPGAGDHPETVAAKFEILAKINASMKDQLAANPSLNADSDEIISFNRELALRLMDENSSILNYDIYEKPSSPPAWFINEAGGLRGDEDDIALTQEWNQIFLNAVNSGVEGFTVPEGTQDAGAYITEKLRAWYRVDPSFSFMGATLR